MSRLTHVEAIFVQFYKSLYLAAILANLAGLVLEVRWGLINVPIYLIDIVMFSVNLAGWVGYRQRKPWASELEKILSIGRVLTILLAATIALAGVVVLFSPVGWILWYKVMFKVLDDQSYHAWYSSCAALLILEALYFCSVTHISRSRSALAVAA